MKITILGRPISKKNSKQIKYSFTLKRKILSSSDAYQVFESSAISQLLKSGYTKVDKIDEWGKVTYKSGKQIKGKVFINYLFYLKGNLSFDGDNAEAGINDILEKCGIIENDKLIIEHHTKKIEKQSDFYTELEILPLLEYRESTIPAIHINYGDFTAH